MNTVLCSLPSRRIRLISQLMPSELANGSANSHGGERTIKAFPCRLAENMGTSVQVIEDHYGHLKPEMVGDELTVE